MEKSMSGWAHPSAKLRSSHAAPSRLARIDEFEVHRSDAENADDGGLLCGRLDAVVMRRVCDAPNEASCGDRHRMLGIEVGAAVDPPSAGKHQRQSIGRIAMRRAHV